MVQNAISTWNKAHAPHCVFEGKIGAYSVKFVRNDKRVPDAHVGYYKMQGPKKMNIVMLGDPGVGKTSLFSAYLGNKSTVKFMQVDYPSEKDV